MPKVSKTGKFRSKSKEAAKSSSSSSLLLSNVKKTDDKNDQQTTETKNTKTFKSKIEEKTMNRPTEGLSKRQRKNLAKREQYQKRQNMIMSSLRLQKLDQQKKRIDGLDLLKEALDDAVNSKTEKTDSNSADKTKKNGDKNSNIVTTNKEKKEIALTEINHMNLVLQHPSFKENPFKTIQQHLKNTFPTTVDSPALSSSKNKKAGKKEKVACVKTNVKTTTSKQQLGKQKKGKRGQLIDKR